MFHHHLVEGDGGLHPFNNKLIQRAPHFGDCAASCFAKRDELCQQGVVVRGDAVALVDVGINPHAVAAGEVQVGDAPRAWAEAIVRIFGVDADLDGVLARRRLLQR